MRGKTVFMVICLYFTGNTYSQILSTVQGKVVVSMSETPLKGVVVKIANTSLVAETDAHGEFSIMNVPNGKHVIQLFLAGYIHQNFPIQIFEPKSYEIGVIYLDPLFEISLESNNIVLTDDDLSADNERSSGYVSGLFNASKDTYLKAAAYNFSQAWFKVRGYDSSYGRILINGVEMNKLYDGRPQWSNWGGLNDAFRNQEFSNGFSPSSISFGGILGTTNFNLRASEYQKVTKISLSSTNKSYTGRAMVTHVSGLSKEGWAYVVSASRRYAQNGYFEGTTYNGWAGFLSVEKRLNHRHSINLAAFASSTRRGKSSPNTQEVYDLKGLKYNAYWGFQEGERRNSRMKQIFEPVAMLSHYYDSEKVEIKTTLAYQFGHIGNSRLGYFNTPNPDPTYWKFVPSSYMRYSDNLDYENAYLSEKEFQKNGQINWFEIYQTNSDNGNSLYYLYEDRVDDKQLSLNSNLNVNLSENTTLNAAISVQNLKSKNYAKMLDLMGGDGFVDLDQYALGEAQQNDLNNPDRLVGVDDPFQFSYRIDASTLGGFVQLQSVQKKIDYYAAVQFKNTKYQRIGLYKNGTFLGNSFGKGQKQSFVNLSGKGGFTYKFTGRHLLNINAGYISNAPTIRTTFSNARVNHMIAPNLKNEKVVSGDVSYLFRAPKIQLRLTGFYTRFSNAIETSFFFAEGLRGNQADFVNEIVTGVRKKNVGIEFSAAYQLIPVVNFLMAGSYGEFTYDNNPHLYLQSESFTDLESDFGTTYLKNYRISGTPQEGYSLGFEYRDPDFWWLQTSANLLRKNHLDISPLLRTDNFYLDADGIPFVDDETGVEVTQNQVDTLLKQERFEDALLINIVGGKSWIINDNFYGFFIAMNNVLGTVFKSGGFEQSRNANYPELKQDRQLYNPIFAPKYWYGNKTTYYLNLYVRF